MKVLFLHSNRPDYLAETLLHGLRAVLNTDCVDFPRCDSLYQPLDVALRSKLRGHGFTVYGLLSENPKLATERFYWQRNPQQFDLFIIANIWWQFEQLLELLRMVPIEKIAILDGIDSPECFPYAGRLLKSPWAFAVPWTKIHYFKRERIEGAETYGRWAMLRSILPKFTKMHSISFSIPAEKITVLTRNSKKKYFTRDIVDPEFSELRQGESYPFIHEQDYYSDLQISRFGLTIKRGGWDCLRHYEMAANGCVLCFRDLEKKPNTCAPHGLNLNNCLIYRNKHDLESQIKVMTPEKYDILLKANYDWIEKNTTEARAREFLNACCSP